VSRIREKRKRAGDDPADDLREHERAGQKRGDPDCAFVARPVTVTGCAVIVIVHTSFLVQRGLRRFVGLFSRRQSRLV